MGTKVKETCTVLSQKCIEKTFTACGFRQRPLQECGLGQFVLFIHTGWKQTAATPYQSCEIDKERCTSPCLSCNRSENRYRVADRTCTA